MKTGIRKSATSRSGPPAAPPPRGRARSAQAAPAIPTGTFTKKIQRQERCERMSPPSGGPAVRPSATTVPTEPSARPRMPGGNAAVTMAGPIAIIALAPSAWTTRAATSPPRPPASPHSADPAVKTARPAE